MITITRGGRSVRPTFNFTESNSYTSEAITAQMSENMRNLLEDQNAMLRSIECLLKRIERRLATRMPLARGRH